MQLTTKRKNVTDVRTINEIDDLKKIETKEITKLYILSSMVRHRLMRERQMDISDLAGSSIDASNHSNFKHDCESTIENECWKYFSTANPNIL